MTEVTAKHAEADAARANDHGPVPRSPRLARRPFLVVLAAVLVAAGALAGGLLWVSATTAGEVVMARQDVARGEVITAHDLGTVRVGVDPSLSTIPAGEMASLVGKRASADLTAGTLVSGTQVSESVVLEALRFGHGEIKNLIEAQEKLVAKAGKTKRVPPASRSARRDWSPTLHSLQC